MCLVPWHCTVTMKCQCNNNGVCQYTRFTLAFSWIREKEVRRGGPKEERVRLVQQGKIETLLSRNEKIALNHLFELSKNCDTILPPSPPPSPSSPQPETSRQVGLEQSLLSLLRPDPRTILIEGPPGGGKSTLALHICHQWAQGASWLERFDVVILAYLRDEAVQNASTLAEILPAYISQLQGVISQIQASYGSRVLFIFDGWDEFPHHLMNNSLVSTIIRQPHKLFLHLSTVLITTRPVSSGNLLHIADRLVEILGFTQHQIREYIGKALDGNSILIQKLVQHLEEHPIIEGYCYVPLHAAILVHIFLTMQGALPTTLHELFCSLVLCCIIREQATHEPDTSLPEMSSLEDLPDDFKAKLSKLNILAYEGVMQNKIIFYAKDLRSSSHLPTDLPSLGLLQAIEGLTLYSKSLSYNFLHLSVQELLAAYHISQMNSSEQVKVFEKLLGSSRFQAVLQYYSGFTKLDNPEIRKIISSYQNSKSTLVDLLPLLHCFFEAQQPSLCQLVDSRFVPYALNHSLLDSEPLHVYPTSNAGHVFNSRTLAPADFLVIGYFINSLLITAMPAPILCLSMHHGVDDHELKLLLSNLVQDSACSGNLVLELYSPSITGQGAERIASHLKQFSSFISKLTLKDGNIQSDEDGLLNIAKALQTNSSLTKLCLINVKLEYTNQNGYALTKMLEVNKSLKYLNLQGNRTFSDFGACCIFKGLQCNTTLVYLNLNYTGVRATHPDTARSLTKMIEVNKSLTHLLIAKDDNRTAGNQIVFCVSRGLFKNNSTSALTHLYLRGNPITTNDAECIARILMSNHSLQTLDIAYSGTWLENRLSCIVSSLWFNTSLKTLYISTNRDEEESFDNFNQTRQRNGLTPIDIRIVL